MNKPLTDRELILEIDSQLTFKQNVNAAFTQELLNRFRALVKARESRANAAMAALLNQSSTNELSRTTLCPPPYGPGNA